MSQYGEQPGFSMNRLTRGQLVLGISSLVLLITLFFPWQDFGGGGEIAGIEIPGLTISGINKALGWLVLLLILGLFVWEGLMMGGVIKGNFNGALIGAAIGGGVALFALILFLTSLDGVAIGAFLGLVATLAVAYGAWLRFQESKTATPPPAGPAAGPPPAAPPPA
jgi:hypothetical protein